MPKSNGRGQDQTMDERTQGQLRVIRKVMAVTEAAGISAQPLGRWADWLFPHLRNGRPWRLKDIGDIEILRGLAAEERAAGQRSLCDRAPSSPH
jgi:hypothetical protein